ncbi:hypothetical protein H4582DRAFT_2054068 [Lactarius indigo]|nr:hypothetical protein H4582DRAFT_2054068 [Lactarius indigo]
MSTPVLLQGLTFDLQSINDLAFDEDCEIFLQLGLLAFLAAFIWFMNSSRSWQEIFETLNGSLSHSSSTKCGAIDLVSYDHVKISMGLYAKPGFSKNGVISNNKAGPKRAEPTIGRIGFIVKVNNLWLKLQYSTSIIDLDPPPGLGGPPGPPPHLHPGSGPCGLTAQEWHGFLIFVILLMLVFLIAVLVSWYHEEEISEIWLRAKHRIQMVRTEWHDELLKHVLPQHDIDSDRLVSPGVAVRAHPAVNFILASLFPSMRHRPGPSVPPPPPRNLVIRPYVYTPHPRRSPNLPHFQRSSSRVRGVRVRLGVPYVFLAKQFCNQAHTGTDYASVAVRSLWFLISSFPHVAEDTRTSSDNDASGLIGAALGEPFALTVSPRDESRCARRPRFLDATPNDTETSDLRRGRFLHPDSGVDAKVLLNFYWEMLMLADRAEGPTSVSLKVLWVSTHDRSRSSNHLGLSFSTNYVFGNIMKV